jgi:signal transduction histidine kinase
MLKDKNKINPNGCGIGLTVSKRYVEMLKGEFEMKSNLGEGTTMSFTIPNVIDKK